MEELVDDNDIDLETLQAQIDLSLANTKNLVSSWVKPNPAEFSSSQASRVDHEKEIQELLKRPPRLGVGAPIPASMGTLGHEAVKLKGKLAGKKRVRESEEQAVRIGQSDEDEEESRAGVIKKKPRVDPFGGFGSKGKKKQQKEDLAHSAPPLEPQTLSRRPLAQSPDDTGTQEQDSDAVSAVKAAAAASDESPVNSPSKKKRKRKHKQPLEQHGVTTSPLLPSMTMEPRAETFRTPSPVGASKLSGTRTPTQPMQPSPPATAMTSGQLSLLNLKGPPLEVNTSPTKKKRKRRKKKKKKADEQSAEPQAEVDAPSEDEEDE